MALDRKTQKIVRGVVDYGGVFAFLVGYLIHRDLVQATWWLVAGSAAALLLGLVVERRIAWIPLVGGVAALIFGGLTLIFHDAVFVKIKPTVINLLLGGLLLGGVALKKNLLKALLGESLHLADDAWKTLAVRFGLYYLATAVLNEIVWRTQPEPLWVAFRFPGLQIMSVLFVLTQLPFMMKHMKEKGEAPPVPPPAIEP
ncbi:MAG: septation protein IspZ [Caulobacteraceae bacterium]|nr:septation protein IspZ [Caulobacteraceae bacterium]